jgi:MYXO-CTERM domain-containing protein
VPPASRFVIERVEPTGLVPIAVAVRPIEEPALWNPEDVQAVGLVVGGAEPLTPGTYRFTSIGALGAHVDATIAEAPLTPGTIDLIVGEPMRAEVVVGTGMSCAEQLPATTRAIHVELPEAARPFAASLSYDTIVDGKPWRPSKSLCSPTVPGRSWVGDGRELLFAVCAKGQQPEWNLEPGAHEVLMRIHAPGSDVAIETAPVSVALACEGAGTANAPSAPEASGIPKPRSCSCELPGGAGGWAGPTLVALAAFVARRRRAGRAQGGGGAPTIA